MSGEAAAHAQPLDAASLLLVDGVPALLAREEQLRDACALPHAVGVLAQHWPDLSAADRQHAADFVVRAVSDFDPLQGDDVLEQILLAESLLSDVAGPLWFRLSEAARPTYDGLSYTSSAAGEALVLLAIAGHGRVTSATAVLLDQVDALDRDGAHGPPAHDEHEEAARRLIRALGLIRGEKGDPNGDIVAALRDLAEKHPEIVDDAAFELGLADVSAALTSPTEPECLARLHEALVWFETAREVEGRPDADLLADALHAILTFAHGQSISLDTVNLLRQRVFGWAQGGLEEEPEWRGQRATALLSWFHLVDRLGQCAELGAAHWWEPASLIAAIGKAVTAQNAVLVATLPDAPPDGAVGPPVIQRVLAPFLEIAEKRAFLDLWLDQATNDDPETRDGIRRVRDLLATPPSTADPPGKVIGRLHEDVRDALALDNATTAQLLDELSPHLAGQIHLALTGKGRINSTGRGLLYEKIRRDLIGQLSDCPEYHGEVKVAGDLLVGEILLFVKDRLDDETHSGSPASYLRKLHPSDEDPKEERLAYDLRDHMRIALPGRPQWEVRDIGGGRVDLVWTWPEFRLVIECKRRKRTEKSFGLDGKLAQAEQYQVTDVPVGALVILDLTEKDRLVDLAGCASIEILPPAHEGGRRHYVATFTVQGNKPTPSSHSRPTAKRNSKSRSLPR
ncbi:conserved hypothetical protein [Frankia sp. AiPs1]|uniref:hypothetical protein n=1 Tax=Frankia sp. AiPa1 TaxID=573492 RepID=UPI00202B800C|nr:hypothetical protein [Frankia sp. AiPa1]MCL9762967.1 hypothetical protein [Frankia sp. AiPa1]